MSGLNLLFKKFEQNGTSFSSCTFSESDSDQELPTDCSTEKKKRKVIRKQKPRDPLCCNEIVPAPLWPKSVLAAACEENPFSKIGKSINKRKPLKLLSFEDIFGPPLLFRSGVAGLVVVDLARELRKGRCRKSVSAWTQTPPQYPLPQSLYPLPGRSSTTIASATPTSTSDQLIFPLNFAITEISKPDSAVIDIQRNKRSRNRQRKRGGIHLRRSENFTPHVSSYDCNLIVVLTLLQKF